MISFLFWNVGGQSRRELIAKLAVYYDVDVLMLVEAMDEPGDLLRSLNLERVRYEFVPGLASERFSVFVTFPRENIVAVAESDRWTIWNLRPMGTEEILLCVVHFPSKYAWSDDSQADECQALSEAIRARESHAGHERTVLVGDLNMNPFERGMVSARGIHGVMDRRIAQLGKRTVLKRDYTFFYNPMWSLFGDGTLGPPGTYYYRRAEHKVYFWNMFDQVLVRPALLNRFQMDDLAIIDHNGLLLDNRGRPNRRVGSDHLPILFRLSE